MYKVFINEKKLSINNLPNDDEKNIAYEDFATIEMALDILENSSCKSVNLYGEDPDKIWDDFHDSFTNIEAAGGIVKNDKNIKVKYNTVVKEIRGNGRVQSVLLEDTETGDETELSADAVFIFVGMKARTELFDTLPKDGAGYIVTDEKMETVMPGLYCAGDVRAKPFRQIVTAVSDGAIAAHEAASTEKKNIIKNFFHLKN